MGTGRKMFNVFAVIVAALALMGQVATPTQAVLGVEMLPTWLLVGVVATYSPDRARVELVKLYRKVQAKLFTGIKFKSEEFSDQDQGKFEVDWSAREIVFPVDLNEGGNVASIPEGGWEALPSSPTLDEASVTWIQLNKRFTVTKIAQYIDENQGARPAIKRQFLWQGAKAVQAIAWTYSNYWYGQSTGVQARVSAIAGNVITLKDAYNVVGLASSGSSYDKAYLTRLFKKGERIAVLNPTGPALRGAGFAKISSVDVAAGTITLDVAPAGSAINDLLVFANNIENTTLVDGTDYNKAPVGLMEVLTATALHGLTHENWSPSYSDTTAGRFNGSKLQLGRDNHSNWAPDGSTMDRLLMDQAVYRDTVAQYMAAVRFDDPAAIEIEGEFKAKRLKIRKTRRVPPGLVVGYSSQAYKRMALFEQPDAPSSFMDGDKLQDQNAMVFMMDYPYQLVVTARKAFTYWMNQQGA